MDEQQINQPVNQPIDQNLQATSHNIPIKVWYAVGAIVVIALALWYFVSPKTPTTSTESTAAEQTPQVQTPPVSSGNTTADISADINQISDDSAALNAAAAASAQAVQDL